MIANDFVYATGLNSFPSAAVRAKTGKKLTTVVNVDVSTAGATSAVA
jgi:hypothetical protein